MRLSMLASSPPAKYVVLMFELFGNPLCSELILPCLVFLKANRRPTSYFATGLGLRGDDAEALEHRILKQI